MPTTSTSNPQHESGPTAANQRAPADRHARTERRRPGREDVDVDDTTELVPVPLRFYALFIVPLLLLMLWAFFLKR